VPPANCWGKAVASWSKIARIIRVPLGFAFAVLYIWLAKPTRTSIALGVGVAFPGLLARAWASGHVEKNEQLAISGPYAHTRNPLYLGSLILGAGFALAARSWWIAVVIVVFFVAIYVPVIRAEEKFLRSRFREFEDYASHVPSLFPRLSRFGETSRAFSWDLYRKHREYNALLGALVVIAGLVAKWIWMR
jgi:protein-S-isoprenylcysteine O-methyltransferase Ste14